MVTVQITLTDKEIEVLKIASNIYINETLQELAVRILKQVKLKGESK